MAEPSQEKLEGDGGLGGASEVVLPSHENCQDLFEKKDVGGRGKRQGSDAFGDPSVLGTVERGALKGAVKNVAKTSGKGSDLGAGIDTGIEGCSGG
jgi:hypothetical protein